jgi:hypothetical protein
MMKALRMIWFCISLILYVGFSGAMAYGEWEIVDSPDVQLGLSLSGVHFPSPNEGWAVGYDYSAGTGALFHFVNGYWTTVPAPDVGSSWDLCSVHFSSSGEGWAVGYDYSAGTGSLLHYMNGNWTAVYSPDVSAGWGLSGVYFPTSGEGWAVGYDYSGGEGVLLHYVNGSWTAPRPPDVSPNWWLSGIHFSDTGEGWAVGYDYIGGTGVLLHYLNGCWTKTLPPEVSADWWLSGVHFSSSTEGWAVGYDYMGGRGVLLHYVNGYWTAAPSPEVSSDWWLSGVHFPSSTEGWAVGYDYIGGRGVLLHYVNGYWTEAPSPEVSSDWWLSGVHFSSSTEGWAVGHSWQGNGILLRYSGEAVFAPSLDGPTCATVGTNYLYSLESSAFIAGHGIEYLFDWGDGTYSGWSSSTSVPKSWSTSGTYTVKAKARCSVHTSFESDWSEPLTVTVTSPPLPDLTGFWTSLVQTCKAAKNSAKCSISGRLDIQNIGSLNAPSSFLRFYLSSDHVFDRETDTLLKQVALGSIKSKEHKMRVLGYSFPLGETASGKFIIAIIDDDKTLPEGDETNNEVVFGPLPAIP